ncbi:MAG: hypothetical protein KJO30_06355 [Boseongicola sp.]|nr:hypothetical protein [Boseongicola sp.]NNJ68537.1 hypothetical protein [Boseongicola sp.]
MTRLLTSLTTFLTIITASAVHAEPNCGPRAAVIAHLADNFGESRQSIGMGQEGRVVEVFASPETGTWTITVTLPNGTTCLVAAGSAFELLAEAPTPGGTES